MNIGLIIIGILSGLSAGLFGIGGGIVIVPLLVYFLGFSQKLAVGTSLTVLLPPIGLLAFIKYYNLGHVDIKAAVIIAISMAISAYLGATIGSSISDLNLKFLFGLFISLVGIYTMLQGI